MVCLEFVPSDVQMCLEFLPSGGFVVLLGSEVKLQTCVVSVTVLKDGSPEFVPSDVQMCLQFLPSGGFVVLLDFRSEATDLHSECCSS